MGTDRLGSARNRQVAIGGDGSEVYRVYRATSSGGYDASAPLARLDAGTSLFMDPLPATTLGTTYYYQVRVEYYGVELGADAVLMNTAIAGATDPVAMAKALTTFAKTAPVIKIKAAVVQGQKVQAAAVDELATMPGKPELYAKLLYVLNAPAQGLVTVLSGVQRGLVTALSAYEKKQSE